MRLRAWVCAGTMAVLAGACGRDGPDVREPLGAHFVGGPPRPAWSDGAGTAEGGARRRTEIPALAALPPAGYTAEQAARGEQVYAATCARCHPPGQLDGETFVVGWNEARASTLFNTLRNTMPQDKPGSLTDEQYVDVIAHMLKRNGVPAGAAPLRADTAALRQLRIDVPTRTQ